MKIASIAPNAMKRKWNSVWLLQFRSCCHLQCLAKLQCYDAPSTKRLFETFDVQRLNIKHVYGQVQLITARRAPNTCILQEANDAEIGVSSYVRSDNDLNPPTTEWMERDDGLSSKPQVNLLSCRKSRPALKCTCGIKRLWRSQEWSKISLNNVIVTHTMCQWINPPQRCVSMLKQGRAVPRPETTQGNVIIHWRKHNFTMLVSTYSYTTFPSNETTNRRLAGLKLDIKHTRRSPFYRVYTRKFTARKHPNLSV